MSCASALLGALTEMLKLGRSRFASLRSRQSIATSATASSYPPGTMRNVPVASLRRTPSCVWPLRNISTVSRSSSACCLTEEPNSGTSSAPKARRSSSITGPVSTACICLRSPIITSWNCLTACSAMMAFSCRVPSSPNSSITTTDLRPRAGFFRSSSRRNAVTTRVFVATIPASTRSSPCHPPAKPGPTASATCSCPSPPRRWPTPPAHQGPAGR